MMFPGAMQDVIYVPRCRDNSASALVGIETGPAVADALDKQAFYSTSGALVSGPTDGAILSGGCVCDVDKKEHQAVVIAAANDTVAGLVLINSAGQTLTVPGTKLTGSGFVTAQSQGMIEKRFAGTRLQAAGTVVFQAVLAPDAGSFKLVERSEVDAAAPPNKIIGGKLDRDGDSDLIRDREFARNDGF